MSEAVPSNYSNPIDWVFRSRASGRVVVAQMPNLPLLVFLAAAALKFFLHPHGQAGTALGVAATVALVTWAALEIARGVNPFRRIAGGVVLLGQAGALLLAR